MKFLFIFPCLLFGSLYAQKQITSVFPLKWSADIGVTTYRTNILFHGGNIFIGSNGKSRESHNDNQDGVYSIDGKSGKIASQFTVPFAGDNDVTAIAINDGKLYFGSDNYYFYCFDLATKKELWKYSLPYDVESTPVISDFNQDGKADVAFVVQYHGFYALDGQTGKLIWRQEFINGHCGNVASALADCNDDGVADIINTSRGIPASDEIDGFKMAHYGDYHIALNGKDGTLLWQIETGAGVHNSPFLYERNGEKRVALLDCYGDFITADLKGRVLSKNNFGYGWFASPVMTSDDHLILGNYAIEFSDKLVESDPESAFPYLSDKAHDSLTAVEGTISGTSVVADVLGKGYSQVLGQTESGELFIMKTDGSGIMNLKLPAGGEASLFVKDIDGDGKLEILIAGLDGKLRCYGTNSRGKVEVGGFR